MATLESKLNDCQKLCDQDPSPENMNRFEVLKTEFELHNDYIRRKIFKDDQSSTSNPQVIMKELHSFYSNLYKKKCK